MGILCLRGLLKERHEGVRGEGEGFFGGIRFDRRSGRPFVSAAPESRADGRAVEVRVGPGGELEFLRIVPGLAEGQGDGDAFQSRLKRTAARRPCSYRRRFRIVRLSAFRSVIDFSASRRRQSSAASG